MRTNPFAPLAVVAAVVIFPGIFLLWPSTCVLGMTSTNTWWWTLPTSEGDRGQQGRSTIWSPWELPPDPVTCCECLPSFTAANPSSCLTEAKSDVPPRRLLRSNSSVAGMGNSASKRRYRQTLQRARPVDVRNCWMGCSSVHAPVASPFSVLNVWLTNMVVHLTPKGA